MFFSHHSKDNAKPKIDLEIIETREQIADDLNGVPIMLLLDQLHIYLRKQSAERLYFLLGSALQELDRIEIEKNL